VKSPTLLKNNENIFIFTTWKGDQSKHSKLQSMKLKEFRTAFYSLPWSSRQAAFSSCDVFLRVKWQITYVEMKNSSTYTVAFV